MPYQLINREGAPMGPERALAHQAGADMLEHVEKAAPLLAADCLEIHAAGHWQLFDDDPLADLLEEIDEAGATIEAAIEAAKLHILSDLTIGAI